MAEKNTLYKKKIVKELFFAGKLSCSDLSTRMNISLPVATRMLNELIDANYIMETGYAPSTGGRRPLMYSFIPDSLYVVAVSMDQLFTRIVFMDIQRRPAFDAWKFELRLAKNNRAAHTLAGKIDEHIFQAGIPKDKIAGIGIGMPGFVDTTRG